MRRATINAYLPQRLQAVLLVFIGVIAAGTVGYILLADMGFVDALYQTVTTLSTVGFREVKPFDTRTKLFTIALILIGVGTVLYTLTQIMELALEGDLRSRFYQRRIAMRIEQLENHYVLCGFGRVGQEIARELRERGVDFVIVEQTPEAADRARAFGYLVIPGDASDERILNEANISRAHCLLAASDSDAGNTYITLTAKSINPGCFVVARVGFPHNEEKLRLAGADRVLSLYSMGGRRMVLTALQPLAADFMDTLASGRHGDLLLTEFEANAKNGLAGITVAQLISGAPNATLLGIRHHSGHLEVGPRADSIFEDGDVAIVLAEERDIAALLSPTKRG
ncbi:MAG: potassium channel family protein [Anaerolineaceae bacterium]